MFNFKIVNKKGYERLIEEYETLELRNETLVNKIEILTCDNNMLVGDLAETTEQLERLDLENSTLFVKHQRSQDYINELSDDRSELQERVHELFNANKRQYDEINALEQKIEHAKAMQHRWAKLNDDLHEILKWDSGELKRLYAEVDRLNATLANNRLHMEHNEHYQFILNKYDEIVFNPFQHEIIKQNIMKEIKENV